MVIYKATNDINGKVYIGQTQKSLEKRKTQHFYKAKNNSVFYFHNAINKYGEENFIWQVICICPNIDSLNEQERYYIKVFNSTKVGYNLTHGGEGSEGYKHTPEALEKRSGKNHPMFGKHPSKKTIEKMRLAKTGKNHPMFGKHPSKKTIEKMSGENNHNWGKSPSLETKEKIRQARLGTHASSETIEKISGENSHNWGKRHSSETIEKRSGKNHYMWGKYHSPEAIEKMRQAKLEYWANKRNKEIK